MDLAAKLGVKVEERAFSVDEAYEAREAFITAASTVVMPVVKINDRVVANGHPGETVRRLREAFFDIAEKTPA